MADLADVANSLVTLAAGAVYPSGATMASITGAPTKLYYGWPVGANLDMDLKAGTVNVSVYPPPSMTKKTTRFPKQWLPGMIPAPTLTAMISGDTVTFGGTGGAGQVAGLLVNGVGYVYVLTTTDTPATVAAAFAVALAALGATATGATLTLPPTARIEAARVATTGQAIEETRRQEQGFIVTVWAPTAMLRDQTAAVIDAVFANTDWLPLPDGSAGRMLYHATHSDDVPANANAWKRALTYTVEYPTLLTMTGTTLLFLCGLNAVNGAAVVLPNVTQFPASIP